MRKIGTILLLMLSLTVVGGCSNKNTTDKQTKQSESSTEQVQKIRVTFTLNEDQKTIDTKTIRVKEDTTVLEALKSAYKVEEKDGFITAIDGKEQDPEKNIYWTYTVNDEFADAANKVKVKDKDNVVFNLSEYKEEQ